MFISASILLRGAWAIIVFAGLLGAISGWLRSRHLAARIDQIARTAEAWSGCGCKISAPLMFESSKMQALKEE